MLRDDYNINKKPISKRNPQANAMVERVHQTIGNMIRTFPIHNSPDLDEDDPWSGILLAVAFGMRAMVHTTTRATPMQTVFGRDAVLGVVHRANWQYIKERKQKLIRLITEERTQSDSNIRTIPAI